LLSLYTPSLAGRPQFIQQEQPEETSNGLGV